MSSPSSSSSVGNVSSAAQSQAVPMQNDVPVLMFHSLQFDPNNPDDDTRIAAETFKEQMAWLYDNGYTTLTMEQLYKGIELKTGFPQKSCVLTFDDGYDDFYTNGWPVLKQYGFHATLFMISGFVGNQRFLSQDQLEDLNKNNVDIEDHTVTHPMLDTLSYNSQMKELSDSQIYLTNLTGHSINYVAYPSGRFNSDTLKILPLLGYQMAFRMSGGWANISDSLYEVPRVYIGNNLDYVIDGVTKPNR